jgi:uncharacterized protein (TIGR02466 family)
MSDIDRDLDMPFATPISKSIVKDVSICKKYADIIFDELNPDQRASLESDLGVCTLSDQLYLREDFKELYDLINSEAEFVFKSVLGLDPDSFVMTGMWANVQINNGTHHIHNHPNSFYSGVVYLDVPESQEPGKIFFMDPRPAKLMWHADFSKPNPLSDRNINYYPGTGLLLFFPSWLDHGTTICKLQPGQHRISLSFNYMLTKSSAHTMKLQLI